jgi:hypothetical protein
MPRILTFLSIFELNKKYIKITVNNIIPLKLDRTEHIMNKIERRSFL